MTGYYIIFEARGKAELKEYSVPDPGDDEVLLESDYSVVSSGTERANLLRMPNTETEDGSAFVPGYSAAGRIIAAGKDVSGLRVGDRAVITWGGHRSHTVKKADSVLKIRDDSIDLIDAAFAHIASFSFLGVRKLRIELGESTMIAGMGLLGAFAVQAAALSGSIPVLVSDFDPLRRKLALSLGAEAAFSPDEADFVEKVKTASGGGGPDAVVEVTGSAAALSQALEYIAWEGRMSLLGCTRISDVPIDFYRYVHRRGISLIGAHTFTRARKESAPGRWTERDDYETFLKLVAAEKLQIRPLISEIVSPESAGAVYARIAETKQAPLGVVFDWRKMNHG